MPSQSTDTFAYTNPAFCALMLRDFVQNYMKADNRGVPLPLMLLPLPIALSGDLADTFNGTNSRTGLITWVSRHPEITLDLGRRIEALTPFSREALLFAISRRILDINDAGYVDLDNTGMKKALRFPATEPRGRILSISRTFGRWVGDVQSTETVLACLRLYQ
ncbi:MAG: hypothetical protein CME31_22485 [Gimesia sp.]|nr:hypothetical protein [Gimesia sp.]|tara:strand:- start:2268 stop:2756 length:489 start_codon:yes stop_codon:yes gene_type:complete